MLPDRLSRETTEGEKNVFRLIRDAPRSEGYSCLHSIGLARHRRKAYGEADFIVIGPAGVFCLEVKGGHVKREAGTWIIGWPGSQYTSTEGPFKQAQASIHPLMDELVARLSFDFKKKIMVGWGVVFPDIAFHEKDPEWDLDVVCDIRHKDDFIGYIQRLARHTRERESIAGRTYPDRISAADCRRIVECFRRDFDLVPLVGDLIAESSRELAELSEQQYSVLRYALDPDNPRVMCPGAAGSGKTLIGLEAARRLGREGLSVLFLCFNRILGTYLRRQISSDDGDVHVWSLHRYMRYVIEEAGFGDQLREAERTTDSDELFRETYSDLFETAVLALADEGTAPEFDVLIVDEAQDILFSPIIDAVALALKGGLAEGRWLFLYDPDLQSELYGRVDERVLENLIRRNPVRLELGENFRNPEPVVDEMCEVTGVHKPVCRRKFPSQVEYLSYENEAEQGKKLRALLVKLLKEGVPASSVTILSGTRKENSCVENYPPDVGKKIVFMGGTGFPVRGDDCFTACTVSSFKGLENDIIIMTDIPAPHRDSNWNRSVVYVGMTRVRTRLYALVSKEFLDIRFGRENQHSEVKNA